MRLCVSFGLFLIFLSLSVSNFAVYIHRKLLSITARSSIAFIFGVFAEPIADDRLGVTVRKDPPVYWVVVDESAFSNYFS